MRNVSTIGRVAGGPRALTDPDMLADPDMLTDPVPSAVPGRSLSAAPPLPREPIGSLLPSVRDARFRRLLGIADLGAAAGGLFLAGALRGHAAGLVAALTIPLIVLLAKMTGRYDHDEVVLRKSTLDEIPALLGLARRSR